MADIQTIARDANEGPPELANPNRPAVIVPARGGLPPGGASGDSMVNLPGIQSAQETFTVPASGVIPPCEMGQNFPIRSVRVDNFTAAWLQCMPGFDLIPPYTYGVIFPVRRSQTLVITPAIVPASPGLGVAGEFYVVTAFDKPQLRSPGSSLGAGGTAVPSGQLLKDTGAIVISTAAQVVPATWPIASIYCVLATTATVGNRQFVLEIKTPAAQNIWRIQAGATVAASLTREILFTAGVTREAAFVGLGTSGILVPLPEGMTLTAGDTYRLTDIANAGGPVDNNDTYRFVIKGR